jgi:IS5 family transposase
MDHSGSKARIRMASKNRPMQTSFSELEYAAKKKVTRRDRFLGELERLVPWAALIAKITPHYPRGEGRGRPPIGLERMLRMYIAQQCFGLSDEGIEDALYDSQAIRRFVGIDLGREAAPDKTTVLNFRRLLEKHDLTKAVFEAINDHLAQHKLLLKEGTVIDASIIAAPSSTKNDQGERDPAMHQTKKGNQWYFGMKMHIGVDADSGLTHTLVTTAANVNDVTRAHALLHGDEKIVFADAGYQGVQKREENRERVVKWRVAMRPGKRRALPGTLLGKLTDALERAKARIRAKVEHPFHWIKNVFGLKKVRYRGLEKNTKQLFTLFGLANLFIAKRRLFEIHAQGAS